MRHEMILETIEFPTGAITQTLTRWAKDYGMETRTVYERYYNGKRGFELIDPKPSDRLEREDIYRMWGKGHWKYNSAKRKAVKFNENQRWVYVGT